MLAHHVGVASAWFLVRGHTRIMQKPQHVAPCADAGAGAVWPTRRGFPAAVTFGGGAAAAAPHERRAPPR
jgi:hypothetical protein